MLHSVTFVTSKLFLKFDRHPSLKIPPRQREGDAGPVLGVRDVVHIEEEFNIEVLKFSLDSFGQLGVKNEFPVIGLQAGIRAPAVIPSQKMQAEIVSRVPVMSSQPETLPRDALVADNIAGLRVAHIIEGAARVET